MNEDIIGGLKSALTRGYSLEEAMFSFFNAGYKKEDIEEAARTLQLQTQNKEEEWQPEPIWVIKQRMEGKPVSNSPSSFKPEKERSEEEQKPERNLSPQGRIVEAKPKVVKEVSDIIVKPTEIRKQVAPGRVSKYSNADSRITTIIIILVVLLLLLMGILGIIFVFKDQVIEFFNNLL